MLVKYKNINIFFEDEGKGQAIVLLHGFLENSSMWSDLRKLVVKKYRIITIDLLGHGKTGCIGYVHTIEDMAKAVDAVIKYLRLRRLVLIGHSMGGYVALAYAELFPHKMKGLCLMNSTSREDSKQRKQLRTDAIAYAKKKYNHLISASIENLFNPETKTMFSKDISAIKKEALQTPLQGYIAAQEGMKLRTNREAVLKSSSYKKLMLIGKKDPVLEYNILKQEAKRTNTKIVEFSGGHMSHIENNKEFTYNIIRFIENI